MNQSAAFLGSAFIQLQKSSLLGKSAGCKFNFALVSLKDLITEFVIPIYFFIYLEIYLSKTRFYLIRMDTSFHFLDQMYM